MKKVVTLALVAAFAVTVGVAFAKSDKCTVAKVEDAKEGEGKVVTLNCKKTKLTEGVKVKVKAEKKVEGC